MHDVTRILSAIEAGDSHAAEQLLPLVYDELRKLAAARLAQEQPGQTLQATALVHEAYLRLVGHPSPSPSPRSGEWDGGRDARWNSRGHFFAAAAEAMRRILVENARRKKGPKHGGDRQRVTMDEAHAVVGESNEDVLLIHEALERFEKVDPAAAQVVKLRYFAGLTMPETAVVLQMPLRTAERHWTYARTWLHRELS